MRWPPWTISCPRSWAETKGASYEKRLPVLRHCRWGDPSNKVYEDELCYAFYDIAPQAPTHFLVIPKAHIASVAEVDGGNSAVVAHIFEVIARLCREKGLESYRVVSNIGEQAGQSVHHLHFHVLSGRDMTWPPG